MKALVETPLDLAGREILSISLASALAEPGSRFAVRGLPIPDVDLEAAWLKMLEACGELGPEDLSSGEVLPAEKDLAPLLEWKKLPADRREKAHQAVFGFVGSRHCPPFESEYLPWKDPTHRAQHLADIAGFYSAFGVMPDPSEPQRHDHVSIELEFTAFLLEKERLASLETFPGGEDPVETCREARHAFLKEHVSWWAPAFAWDLAKRCREVKERLAPEQVAEDVELLAGVARLLRAWVTAERVLCGISPSERSVGPEVRLPVVEESLDSECEGCGAD
ncbi:MAG: hypothetical protein GHCLOJNM_01835 [bacterium]|nr:hypothetical protein [bacterium]